MKIKIYIYILLFLPLLGLASCVADEIPPSPAGDPEYFGDPDGIPFSLMVENFGKRTRNVDFTTGSQVKINSVWVGVFDRETRECVAAKSVEQRFIEINSGTEYKNLIRVPLPAPPAANQEHEFFMFCVVNYQDVYDQDGNLLEDRLEEMSQKGHTWEHFIKIAVDTKSAYTYPHDSDAPIMAGFFRAKDESKRPSTHIQVNQWDDKHRLYPDPDSFKEDIVLTYNAQKGYTPLNPELSLDSKIFSLRRLVANISVNIEVDKTVNPNLEIIDVQFKRFNLPEAVYIIERRTVKNDDGFTDENPLVPQNDSEAANYADYIWATSNGTKGYTNDDEWQIITNRDNEGRWTFSFQHFANKHWARTIPLDQHDRERHHFADDSSPDIKDDETSSDEENPVTARNVDLLNDDPDYVFTHLANDLADFNNKASYFKIKMHMRDVKTNKCAEAIYIIHEGNTSNPDGSEVPDNMGNLSDYVVARNISYLYNIKVQGFNRIFYNVEGNNSSTPQELHKPDQGGMAWEMLYINDTENNRLQHYYTDSYNVGRFMNCIAPNGEGYQEYTLKNNDGTTVEGSFIKFENALTFDPKPNLAFRLYGYTDSRTVGNDASGSTDRTDSGLAGYNFNFERTSFDYLTGLWPAASGLYSHYYDTVNDLEGQNAIPKDLLDGLRIEDPEVDCSWNIPDFVIYASKSEKPKNYNVYIRESNLEAPDYDKESKIRALYIADRNGLRDYNIDECSNVIKIFSIVQEPSQTLTFQANPVYKNTMYDNWMKEWNENHTGLENSIKYVDTSSAGNIWTGATNSVVNIGFNIKQDLMSETFKIKVLDNNNNPIGEPQEFNKEDLNYNYYYIEFPLKTNWDDVIPGTYGIELSPSNTDEDENKVILQNCLVLSLPKWEFNTAPWNRVDAWLGNLGLDYSENRDTKNDPNSNKMYSKEKHFFFEDKGLELGIYEIRNPIYGKILDAGKLITMAEPTGVIPGELLDNKSYQLKIKVSKEGTLKIKFSNSGSSNVNTKTLYVQLGKNLISGNSRYLTSTNFVANTNGASYTWEIPITISDTYNRDEYNDVLIWTQGSVGWIYSVEYTVTN